MIYHNIIHHQKFGNINIILADYLANYDSFLDVNLQIKKYYKNVPDIYIWHNINEKQIVSSLVHCRIDSKDLPKDFEIHDWYLENSTIYNNLEFIKKCKKFS